MERIEKDYGTLMMNNGRIFDVDGNNTGEGFVFKDSEAFKTGVGICYVSEFGLQEIHEELADLQAQYENGEMSDEEYEKAREHVILNIAETRQTIIDLVRDAFAEDYLLNEEQIVYFAQDVFDLAEWAYVSTYLDSGVDMDECIEYDDGEIFTDFQREAVENGMTPHEYLLKKAM